MNNAYLDLYDNPANLTEAEIKWFSEVCIDCMEATGIKILIECADHYREYKGKSKEALGTFHTDNIENPLDGNCKITIDNYFIHECYEEVFNNGHNLNFEDLEHVIAHEFAHGFQWRHCKRHTQLTEELYQKIKVLSVILFERSHVKLNLGITGGIQYQWQGLRRHECPIDIEFACD